MAMVGEGEDAKGVLTEVKRGHSASELSVGVGRGLGVKGMPVTTHRIKVVEEADTGWMMRLQGEL
ncbi:hypothetical protein EYF80_008463 [Liparis tanakae]|uniref:Uncharacterized protein n=1 Tax=Liparis tanakae TaxID=230148 RepID=A0A4Z2IUI6_9TELE|nr:hypothetical protein EYF80_008463 [Liparis tanakae]